MRGIDAIDHLDLVVIKLELVHRPSEMDLASRVAELTERLNRLERGGEDSPI